MTQTLEVDINEAGEIHTLDPSLKLPKGRALLICANQDGTFPVLLPGDAFADWFTPEEDAAWAHLHQSNAK